MELFDTHCHIHSAGYELAVDDPTRVKWLMAGKQDPDEMIESAKADGVTQLICVGTDHEDSERAATFVQDRDNCWASIGIHPHEAKRYAKTAQDKQSFALLAKRPKVVAIGEAGLDYYYSHSPKEEQQSILRFQLELAVKHSLPLIFHVREAFDDFWQILDDYDHVRGVLHSFTDTESVLHEGLGRGLYIGLNGIMTFTKLDAQLEMAKAVPLDRLLLETDAPYLTPTPFRGTICEPKHVRVTAEFLTSLREDTLEQLASATTRNAKTLFGL